MEVYSSNHDKIVLDNNAFSSGGEGEVRNVLNAPAQFSDVCVKLYYQKKRTPELEQKIKFMVANPPAKVKGNGFMIGWPLDYVTDAGGKFLGFVMPLAFPNSEQLIKLTAPKLSKKLDQAWYDRYDRTNGISSLINRLKLINNISIPIHLLHSTNKYVLRDFKPENVLITHNGQVTLVDMDSVQIANQGKLLFPGTAATPNYIPPEHYLSNVGKTATYLLDKSWDNFALGVVYYQILLGLHPYVVTPYVQKDANSNEIFQNIAGNLFPFGANASKIKSYPDLHKKFNALHPKAKNLFLRAFSSIPADRPSAEEWGRCMNELVAAAPPIPTPKPKPAPKPQPQPQPQPPSAPEPIPYTYPTKEELASWNWGAFFFGWIWALGQRVYWPLVQLVMMFIPVIGQIGSIALSVYLGIHGNEIGWKAWQSRTHVLDIDKGWDTYKENQRFWVDAIWWVLGGSILVAILSNY